MVEQRNEPRNGPREYTFGRNEHGVIMRNEDKALVPEHEPNNPVTQSYHEWLDKGNQPPPGAAPKANMAWTPPDPQADVSPQERFEARQRGEQGHEHPQEHPQEHSHEGAQGHPQDHRHPQDHDHPQAEREHPHEDSHQPPPPPQQHREQAQRDQPPPQRPKSR
jgi:hypothetical protein